VGDCLHPACPLDLLTVIPSVLPCTMHKLSLIHVHGSHDWFPFTALSIDDNSAITRPGSLSDSGVPLYDRLVQYSVRNGCKSIFEPRIFRVNAVSCRIAPDNNIYNVLGRPIKSDLVAHMCRDAHEPTHVSTMSWDETAITCDDPNFPGQGNKDTGEGFHAAPDIDHNNDSVQAGFSDYTKCASINVSLLLRCGS
jgi:hypothetical protein